MLFYYCLVYSYNILTKEKLNYKYCMCTPLSNIIFCVTAIICHHHTNQ